VDCQQRHLCLGALVPAEAVPMLVDKSESAYGAAGGVVVVVDVTVCVDVLVVVEVTPCVTTMMVVEVTVTPDVAVTEAVAVAATCLL